MTRIAAILAVVVVVAGLAALVLIGPAARFLGIRGDDRFAACLGGAVPDGSSTIGGPFSLTGRGGATVTDAQAITKPTLLYFGYTFCPDVCPTDLSRNALAADILAERGVDVGLVFITIDPDRDTPDIAAEYAAAIHPEMIGLGGTPEQIAAAAKAYRLYYHKAGDDPTSYLMEHSTFTYLVAPGYPFLDFFPSDATPEQVAERVSCFTEQL